MSETHYCVNICAGEPSPKAKEKTNKRLLCVFTVCACSGIMATLMIVLLWSMGSMDNLGIISTVVGLASMTSNVVTPAISSSSSFLELEGVFDDVCCGSGPKPKPKPEPKPHTKPEAKPVTDDTSDDDDDTSTVDEDVVVPEEPSEPPRRSGPEYPFDNCKDLLPGLYSHTSTGHGGREDKMCNHGNLRRDSRRKDDEESLRKCECFLAKDRFDHPGKYSNGNYRCGDWGRSMRAHMMIFDENNQWFSEVCQGNR